MCDNFLTSNQQILSETQWEALEASWNAAGEAIECVNSGVLGDLKSEIEKLCSKTTCDYATQQLILNGLGKIQTLGKKTLP